MSNDDQGGAARRWWISLALSGATFLGCGGPGPGPEGGLVLDADELARARGGWTDASASVDVGGTITAADVAVIVLAGRDPAVMIAWDALTDNADPADVRGRFSVPEARAAELAASGWDLDLGPSELEAPGRPALLEGALGDAVYERVRLRAEPDRLFVMEIDVVAAGVTTTISVFGHLTGGCFRDEAGAPEWIVVDPAADERCASVVGTLP